MLLLLIQSGDKTVAQKGSLTHLSAVGTPAANLSPAGDKRLPAVKDSAESGRTGRHVGTVVMDASIF